MQIETKAYLLNNISHTTLQFVFAEYVAFNPYQYHA